MLMVALLPQPNIYYKLYELWQGKNFLDMLFIAVFLGIFINKKGFVKSENAIIIVIFLVVSYLSVWNVSANFGLPAPITRENSVLVIWKSYFVMIVMYFLTINAIQDEKRQKQLIVIMSLVVLFIALRSFRSFKPGISFIEESRDAGPFWIVGLGSNHHGAFVAYCFSFIMGLFLLDTDIKRKLLYLATLFFSLHPLFFTYSRGAYLAALSALFIYGILKDRRLLVAVVIIVLLWQVVLPSSVVERIQMTKESSSGELESSAAVRLDLWDSAIDMFHEYPVFGSGFKGFTLAHRGEHWADTHNLYLKTLSEQGIIGGLLLLIIMLGAVRSGWKLYRRGDSSFQRGLGLGFLGCVTAHIVANIFGDRFSYFEMGSYFWVFWGLVDRGILITQASKQKLALAENAVPSC
jgi:O-antigen ligase